MMSVTPMLAMPGHPNESWQIPRTGSARKEESYQSVEEYDRRQQDAKNEEDVECGRYTLRCRRKRDIYNGKVSNCQKPHP